MSEIKDNIEKTVQWLRDKTKEAHCNGLVIGLSGGIDSSVCAALMVKALGENALGVIMPIKSQNKDKEDAIALAKAIGINYIVVDATEEQDGLYTKILNKMQIKDLSQKTNQLSDANLRARTRMGILYTVANLKNYLVVGTDNAAELYTGYFTKYGDGGVDILPIAHLSKGDVYAWGKVLAVPQVILDREPSAGLWQGQTDEKEMGTTYAYIDKYLAGGEIPEKDKEIIENLHRKSEHKRHLPPQGPSFD